MQENERTPEADAAPVPRLMRAIARPRCAPPLAPARAAHGIVLLLTLGAATSVSADIWRGLVVAPEDRCENYDRTEYYTSSESVERSVIRSLGGHIYGPYTGRYFDSPFETEVEHIIALAEAHHSGMCATSAKAKRRFGRDLLNLTLAAPGINRAKSSQDAAEWLPPLNKCWFAARVLKVRKKYSLTIDRAEADVLDATVARVLLAWMYAETTRTDDDGLHFGASYRALVEALEFDAPELEDQLMRLSGCGIETRAGRGRMLTWMILSWPEGATDRRFPDEEAIILTAHPLAADIRRHPLTLCPETLRALRDRPPTRPDRIPLAEPDAGDPRGGREGRAPWRPPPGAGRRSVRHDADAPGRAGAENSDSAGLRQCTARPDRP